MEIVDLHSTISRDVSSPDLPRVLKDAYGMRELCFEKHGLHSGGLAVAHMQVTSEDPLRFFVTKEGDVFMNPKIIGHSKRQVLKEEGCLSFPNRLVTKVLRCPAITVMVEIFDEEKLEKEDVVVPKEVTIELDGIMAQVFQHEINHFDCKTVWDK